MLNYIPKHVLKELGKTHKIHLASIISQKNASYCWDKDIRRTLLFARENVQFSSLLQFASVPLSCSDIYLRLYFKGDRPAQKQR